MIPVFQPGERGSTPLQATRHSVGQAASLPLLAGRLAACPTRRRHERSAPVQTPPPPGRGRGVMVAHAAFNRGGEGSSPSDPTWAHGVNAAYLALNQVGEGSSPSGLTVVP